MQLWRVFFSGFLSLKKSKTLPKSNIAPEKGPIQNENSSRHPVIQLYRLRRFVRYIFGVPNIFSAGVTGCLGSSNQHVSGNIPKTPNPRRYDWKPFWSILQGIFVGFQGSNPILLVTNIVMEFLRGILKVPQLPPPLGHPPLRTLPCLWLS